MKRFSRVVIPVCCVIAIYGLAIGSHIYGQWQYARQLVNASKVSQMLAESGDAKAECDLGRMYDSGLGVSQDYSKAFQWAIRSANQGNAAGDSLMGELYFYGHGVSLDYGEALRWYTMAAAKGNAYGQYGIGYMYRNGLGVQKDDRTALEWFRRSADQGNAQAQFELGYLYQEGFGVAQDYALAAYWYQKASAQNYAKAESAVGYLEFYGYGVPKNRSEAKRWFHKAAEQGETYARRTLGQIWLGMSGIQLAVFALLIFAGAALLIGSVLNASRSQFRADLSAWAGALSLISAGSWWYRWSHYSLVSGSNGISLFMAGKFLLDGVLLVLLILVLRGEKRQSEGA